MTISDKQQQGREHAAHDYYELRQMNRPGIVMISNQLEGHKHETVGQGNILQVARP